MNSPFPGMDPFLELDWGDVHSRLITYMADEIQPRLPKELFARMETRVLVEDDAAWDDEERRQPQERYPDVHVTERSLGGGTAVLEQVEVEVAAAADDPDYWLLNARPEPETQRNIIIYDHQSGGRVITAIELLSPSNKLPGVGQKLYLKKRQECAAAGVNLVEIDLTRKGDRLTVLQDLARVQPQPTYAALLTIGFREQVGAYVMPLAWPLKKVRIPLRPKDKPVTIDLQALVSLAYERGRYANLDYTRPLDPPANWEEAAVIERLLREAGKLPAAGGAS